MSETRYFDGTRYVNNIQAPRDIVDEGAYLIPSQSNAAVICQWMQKIESTYNSVNFWSNVATSNALSYITSTTGGGYIGCVYQQDGTVFMWPANTDGGAIVFNPSTGTVSTYNVPFETSNQLKNGCLLPDGRTLAVPQNPGFPVVLWNNASQTTTTVSMSSFGIVGSSSGACLLPGGQVCISPGGLSNVLRFDQYTSTFTNVFTLTETRGCTLDVTGNVVFVPSTVTAGIVIWNPTTNTRSTISITGLTDAFNGSAVVPDGRIVFGSWNQNHIGVYNPLTYSYTSYPISVPDSVNFSSVQSLPNGTVLFRPFHALFFGIFNPKTNTFSTFSPPGIEPFTGSTVIPDGRIIMANNTIRTGIPVLTGLNAPVPREWCLHPFFNKCAL